MASIGDNLISAARDDVVCVVGMHRSGTSLIAQLLKQSGLNLGADESLLGSNVGNQDGHFEHTGFIEINDAILKHHGGSWEFPPELPIGWEKAAILEPLRDRARDLIQSFAGRSPWGWKDPRTTLLLPFWRSVIANLRLVICIRSPLAVAQSLEARDKIPLARGAYLWDRYLRAALADTQGCRRLVVFYDRFFQQPAKEISRLVEFCRLSRSSDIDVLATAIRDDLSHQKNDVDSLLASNAIPRESKLLYLTLRGLAGSDDYRGAVDTGSEKSLHDLVRLLDDSAQQIRLTQLQAKLNRTESELANLRAEIWAETKVNHPWAYRVYRKILRPWQMARFRQTR